MGYQAKGSLHVFGPTGEKGSLSGMPAVDSDILYLSGLWGRFVEAETNNLSKAGAPLRAFLHDMETASAVWLGTAKEQHFFDALKLPISVLADFRSTRLTRFGDDIDQLVAGALVHVPCRFTAPPPATTMRPHRDVAAAPAS